MNPDFRAVRAICFDLDDTLCAYWNAAKSGLRATFERHPLAGMSADDMVRHWAAVFREFSPKIKESEWYEGYLESGEPTRTEHMRRTLRRIGVEDEALARELSECYMGERDRALALFEDAGPVLRSLHGRYKLGLITNGPADIQRQEIATLGIAPFFDLILIEGEMKIGKPHASVFARAAEALGCSPHEVLFVGNSYAHDVVPALANGWRAVWVRRESDAPPSADPAPIKAEQAPMDGPQADAVISNLREIQDLLSV
ncbi:MAG TPA: HAD family hydrolase [Fimbriimonadaceae bacterium]|nr:HAD family hydrolase [Fimbriimonadaceae bacterium]